MLEVKRNSDKTLELITPSNATSVTITISHEFGDVVVPTTSATGSGMSFSYSLSPEQTDSCGVHKVTWDYLISSVSKKKVEYITIYQPYVSETSLILDYPELEGLTDNFVSVEKNIRKIVDTYCGQSFMAYPNKTIKLDGTGANVLHVWYRVEDLRHVYVDGDTANDIIDSIEIAPDSDFYIRKKNSGSGGNKSEAFERMFTAAEYSNRLFNKRRVYHVQGDFGWGYVPTNVEEATKLLMQDWYNQDSTHRRHGVIFAGVGPVQTNYQTDLLGTTGNIDADVLLMDYTKFVMDYI